MNTALVILLLFQAQLFIITTSCQSKSKISANSPLRSLVQISDTNEGFVSKLTPEKRLEYETLLSQTKSFALSLKFLPKVLEPEKLSYIESLNWLIIIFVLISLFPIGILLIYIVLRFFFKKCTGPTKGKEITLIYKAVTWILLAIGIIGILILSIFILDSSTKVKNGFTDPLTRYSQSLDSIQNSITPLNTLFELIYPHLSPTQIDKSYFNNLSPDLTQYVTHSKAIISEAISKEYYRDVVANIFCYIYLVILVVNAIAFRRRWKNVCLTSALISFLTVGTLIIIEGYNAFYYFHSSNICSAVNASMYQHQFPIAKMQIGYYFNCFDNKISSQLVALNYLIEEAKVNVKDNTALLEQIEGMQKTHLNDLLHCKRVYDTLPDLEESFCYKGIDLLNSILLYYPWMLIFVFIFGLALNRVEIHIWKNKMDISAILENSVILY